MMTSRLVLDANILIRAAIGARVRRLLDMYEDSTEFFAPVMCFDEARRSVSSICAVRGLSLAKILDVVENLSETVQPVPVDLYAELRESALARIGAPDEADWPVVATALHLDCAVWTEDRDFFGCGVATWMTSTVEVYLRG